jgi:predicted deacetylase
VVLHDVSTLRWPGCLRVWGLLQQLALEAGVDLPVTLLVVPRMHGTQPAPEFLQWLRQAMRRGHELALHGYTHRDDSPPGVGWLDHVRRRWYTDGEGEFAALDHTAASERLNLGLAWARRHRLAMPGFVAPAWLMNAPVWDAVQAAGFRYTSTLGQVVSLPQRQPVRARSLVFSTRRPWRRLLSVAWNLALATSQRRAPVLRLELHPSDADHPAVRWCWSVLLAAALRGRQPLRLSEVAALAAAPAG